MSSPDSAWHDMVVGRLDHHSERLVKLEERDVQFDTRLRRVEEDHEDVRQLVKTVGWLTEEAKKLLSGAEQIAERAAAKVWEEKERERKELSERRHELRRESWTHRLALVSAASAAFGGSAALVARFSHVLHFLHF